MGPIHDVFGKMMYKKTSFMPELKPVFIFPIMAAGHGSAGK